MNSRSSRIWACAALSGFVLPAFGGSYSAVPAESPPLTGQGPAGSTPVEVRYLDEETRQLQTSVELGKPPEEIFSHAHALFEAIPRPETTNIPPIPLRGWSKPDLSEGATTGKVDGLQDASAKALASAMRMEEVPPPLRRDATPDARQDKTFTERLQELLRAWLTGKRLREDGKVRYDGEDGRRRLPNEAVMGAYIYTLRQAIGVIFHPALAKIARAIGDKFAAATMIHEFEHARRDGRGELSPARVKDGEVDAFQAQYAYLMAADPTGQELSRLRTKFAPSNPKSEPVVTEYLEHLASVRRECGQRGACKRLVEELGYQDRHAHDNFEGDGHDHR